VLSCARTILGIQETQIIRLNLGVAKGKSWVIAMRAITQHQRKSRSLNCQWLRNFLAALQEFFCEENWIDLFEMDGSIKDGMRLLAVATNPRLLPWKGERS
jgi:hypothetical protein